MCYVNTIKVKITKFKGKSLLHGFRLTFVQDFTLTGWRLSISLARQQNNLQLPSVH